MGSHQDLILGTNHLAKAFQPLFTPLPDCNHSIPAFECIHVVHIGTHCCKNAAWVCSYVCIDRGRDCSKLMLCAAMFTLQRTGREIERLQQTDEISPIFLNEDSHFPPPVGQCVSWHKVKRKRRQLRTQKDYPTMKNITLLQKLTSLIGFQMFGKNPQR